MEARGWKVTAVNYDFDREVYAWRHEQRGGNSPTLRINRAVLENYPAFALMEHIAGLKVARLVEAFDAAGSRCQEAAKRLRRSTTRRK